MWFSTKYSDNLWNESKVLTQFNGKRMQVERREIGWKQILRHNLKKNFTQILDTGSLPFHSFSSFLSWISAIDLPFNLPKFVFT